MVSNSLAIKVEHPPLFTSYGCYVADVLPVFCYVFSAVTRIWDINYFVHRGC